MVTLEELKLKYPNQGLKYEPFPDCPRCHGSGEYRNGLGKMSACFCLYVDSEFSEFFGDINNWFNDPTKFGRNSNEKK